MDKAYEIQRKARDNVQSLQTCVTDLQNWEIEMKRKEAALNGNFEQDLPPVRSKIRKERPVLVPKKPDKRIRSSEYDLWEKFDVVKACKDIDLADMGPISLDSKESEKDKQEKLREEGLYEKEKGNVYVKQEKWDDAIKCYNRAIELVKDEAIYYANRGLCHLKKDSLHQADADCTEALRLDPTYVKALQRRAAARERLGSLRAASHDLNEVLKLEPNNTAAKKQLEAIKARMGTKGTKSKSSPTSSPINEQKPITVKPKVQTKTIDKPDEATKEETELSAIDKWRNGIGEDVTVIKTVKKPPHLRSKRPLRQIQIKEIQLGKTSPEKTESRLKINVVGENQSQGDTNNNDSNEFETPTEVQVTGEGDASKAVVSGSTKLVTKSKLTEDLGHKLVPPVNSVQFMSEWKYLKGNNAARSDYLSIIDPMKIPTIFTNALESDVLSDILHILHDDPAKFKERTVTAYLASLCSVKRFSALAMFLNSTDKEVLRKLLDHCKNVEKCSEEDITDLKNKYEL